MIENVQRKIGFAGNRTRDLWITRPVLKPSSHNDFCMAGVPIKPLDQFSIKPSSHKDKMLLKIFEKVQPFVFNHLIILAPNNYINR